MLCRRKRLQSVPIKGTFWVEFAIDTLHVILHIFKEGSLPLPLIENVGGVNLAATPPRFVPALTSCSVMRLSAFIFLNPDERELDVYGKGRDALIVQADHKHRAMCPNFGNPALTTSFTKYFGRCNIVLQQT